MDFSLEEAIIFIILNREQAYPLIQRETSSLPSKATHSTNSLRRQSWTKAVSASAHETGIEMLKTHTKISLQRSSNFSLLVYGPYLYYGKLLSHTLQYPLWIHAKEFEPALTDTYHYYFHLLDVIKVWLLPSDSQRTTDSLQRMASTQYINPYYITTPNWTKVHLPSMWNWDKRLTQSRIGAMCKLKT